MLGALRNWGTGTSAVDRSPAWFFGSGALSCALAGCATVEPHLMPTPAVFRNERLERMPRLPPELRRPK